MSLTLKTCLIVLLLASCGDKTKSNKSEPQNTSSQQTNDDATQPASTAKPADPSLNPSKLNWDGVSLKGTVDFMIVPMD